jgi:hypothetical protein
VQAPDTQVWALTHALPQLPQLALLEVRFTQLLLQSDCPLGQVQAPVTQVCVLTQAVPHRPQLAVLT